MSDNWIDIGMEVSISATEKYLGANDLSALMTAVPAGRLLDEVVGSRRHSGFE